MPGPSNIKSSTNTELALSSQGRVFRINDNGGKLFQFLIHVCQIFFHLFLRGDVARSRKHAEYLAAGILVDRGVVEHVRQPAVFMPNGEWVIGDEALGEDLPVAVARLLRLGEVVREVGAN